MYKKPVLILCAVLLTAGNLFANPTNLVVIGASIINAAFGSSLEEPHQAATSYFRATTGLDTLNVYGYGFSGLLMAKVGKQDESMLDKLDQAYAAFPTNTVFVIDTGGNDITAMSPRAYSLANAGQLLEFQDDLDAVFDKVNERAGDVIVMDLTYRAYRNTLNKNADENFLIDHSGSGPYIENEYRPRQQIHQPQFLNTDGRSVIDLYNLTRNRWTSLLHFFDGVHLNASSYPVLREFILDRVAYIFTSEAMPPPIEPVVAHSDYIVIDFGATARADYNEREARFHPINFLAITNTTPNVRNLKSITGKDFGSVSLVSTGGATGVSTNTLLPSEGLLSYGDWELYSPEIMGAAFYFDEGTTNVITMTGLNLNSQYTIRFAGSTTESDGGELALADSITGNYDAIDTRDATPIIGEFIAHTTSTGVLTLDVTSSSGRGYLSGVSVDYLDSIPVEQQIEGTTTDAAVRYVGATETYAIFDLNSVSSHIGNRNGSAVLYYKVIYVFELPELPENAQMDTAQLEFTYLGRDGFSIIDYDVNLVAVRHGSADSVLTTDYYGGVLIQESILTLGFGASPQRVSTSLSASEALSAWIMDQYNNGASAGDNIFLRLEFSSDPPIGFNSFRVAMANEEDEENRPVLSINYTQLDVPAIEKVEMHELRRRFFYALYGAAGGELWTPAELTTLAWIDFSDASTITTGSVSRITAITDKTENGLVFSGANTAARPTIGATQNGLTTARFAGAQLLESNWVTEWNFLHNGTKHSIFAVFMSDTNNVTQLLFDNRSVVTGNPGAMYRLEGAAAPAAIRHASGRNAGGAYYCINTSGSVLTSGYNITGAIADLANATASARSTMHINGGAAINNNEWTTAITTANATQPMYVGARNVPNGPDTYLTGNIGELLFIDGMLSTADRQRVEGYLAHKWGLTANLPSDHPYKYNPPMK